MGRRIARSQTLFVKCPCLPTLRPLADAFGARNISADVVANGAVPTLFQPRPWGRMNAGRRQTPGTKRTVKNRAPAFRLRAPEIVGRGSWSPNRPGTCERLEKLREGDRGGGHALSRGR